MTRIIVAVLVLFILLVCFAAWYMTSMPGESHRGALSPLGAAEQELAVALQAHVKAIASEEHNVGHPAALERSARYIESTLAGFGYAVTGQAFEVGGVKVRNVEVSIAPPAVQQTKPRLVVVGAHYDSARGAVGADDNGSGAAALLELARKLKAFRPADGIELRLVFYVNEELPYFSTERMGSLVHASGLQREGRQVLAMLSLETIAYYSDAPGSQRYPFPFNLFYPNTGNFIGFVANPRSRALVQRVVASFRRHAQFPSEGAVGPEFIDGIGWSDQWAYWKYGWPAVMVTDTAPFRYPHYHTLRDTPDKLDYERTARVVQGIEQVVRELAGTPAPD